MTPAQRLAHALYGSHGDTAVLTIGDHVKRQIDNGLLDYLREQGYTIICCETCGDDPEVCASIPGLRHCAAAIQAYQQEIET